MKDHALLNALWDEVEAGRVTVSQWEGLSIFKYTQETHIKGLWNEANRQARGIIFHADGTVVARPFPKFFNLGENEESKVTALPWQHGVEIFEKMDGCFEYHTPILLEDGTFRSIGEIVNQKLKASIMGWDHDRQCFVRAEVTNWFKYRQRDDWLELTIDYPFTLSSGGRGQVNKLRVTSNHEFWNGNHYVAASTLRPGDAIQCYDKEPSLDQQSMMLGSLLGDSSVCQSGQYTGVFQGNNKDQAYVNTKRTILGTLNRNDKTQMSGLGTKMFRYRSERMRWLHKVRQEWYPNGVKVVPQNLSWLGDIAVAFWYMDDGSLSHSDKQQDRAVFATNGFSRDDCERLAQQLRTLYLVDAVVFENKGWNIRINAGRNNEIDTFWSHIAPYIPPSMRYKLPTKYKDSQYCGVRNNCPDIKLCQYTIVDIKYKQPRNKTAYDIETTTHNYMAKGVLVHNSCGIGYRYHGEWRLATPGSMESEQAIEGTRILNESCYQDPYPTAGMQRQVLKQRYNLEALPTDCTPVFEIIYPENRIVVDYAGETFLSLLAIFEHNGTEWHPRRVDQIAERCGFRRPRRFDIDLRADVPFEDNSEGYVARFADGTRVKVKSPTYLRIHRLLNYLSPKGVIDLIRGKEYGAVLAQLPKEIAKDFDDVRAHVQGMFNTILTAAYENLSRLKDEAGENQPRKTYAEWIIANVTNSETGFVFALLDGKDIEDKVWKLVQERVRDEAGPRTTEVE